MAADRGASVLEVGALRGAAERYDVAILGGGLAGLTLAIQLKRARPETSIAVLEKREGPAPLAAFKVGESTVPSGSHYFGEVVGMLDHMQKDQLRKCGLRFFFPTEDNAEITKRPEGGPPVWPPHADYQLDRGSFENELARRVRALKVDLLQGCRVQEITLGEGDDPHTVAFTQGEQPTTTKARWIVDAAGRASLLKRKLGLSRDVSHTINSSWFRLAGGIDLEQWGADDQEWLARMKVPGIRHFSTNHLLGEGYWVWMIPLHTGPISVGVCADPRYHDFDEISQFDRLLDWLGRHEPQLAATVAPRLDDIQDFLRVEDFAYGVEQAYSTDRWTLVGEAAAFADPFYSPGSDFIGYGNCFSTDLITRELDGEDIGERTSFYNDFYQRTFAHVLSRTEDMYPAFGNPWVGMAKNGWDTFLNHTGVVNVMLANKLMDFEFLRSVNDKLDRLYRLNINMHKMFAEWHQLEQRMLPPIFLRGYAAIRGAMAGIAQDHSEDELHAVIEQQVKDAEVIAVDIFNQAAKALPDGPPEGRSIDPYVISLRPEDWESDGLFSEGGMTAEQARELAPGADIMWGQATPTASR
jgi:flavin-dependent dehydrogenase